MILWRSQKARARNQEKFVLQYIFNIFSFSAFQVLYTNLIKGGTISSQERNTQIPLDQQLNQIVYDHSKFKILCDDLEISEEETVENFGHSLQF